MSVRAAIFQCDAGGLSRAARLERLDLAAERAGSADLLLCPELYASGYAIGEAVFSAAEPTDGPFAAAVARIAEARGLAIAYGYPEAAEGAVFNAAQAIDASGRRIANHRKRVLPPGPEPTLFAPGAAAAAVFEIAGLRVALAICYEIEFPEIARAAAQAGADALLVPTALGVQWDGVARRTAPTRAMENGVFLLYANHAGREGERAYLGASCVLGPDGEDLARAGAEEDVIAATLKPAQILAARARLPYLADAARLKTPG